MEKLAYGMSVLTLLYIAFLYLTTKMLIKDSSYKPSFPKKKKPEQEKDQ